MPSGWCVRVRVCAQCSAVPSCSGASQRRCAHARLRAGRSLRWRAMHSCRAAGPSRAQCRRSPHTHSLGAAKPGCDHAGAACCITTARVTVHRPRARATAASARGMARQCAATVAPVRPVPASDAPAAAVALRTSAFGARSAQRTVTRYLQAKPPLRAAIVAGSHDRPFVAHTPAGGGFAGARQRPRGCARTSRTRAIGRAAGRLAGPHSKSTGKDCVRICTPVVPSTMLHVVMMGFDWGCDAAGSYQTATQVLFALQAELA